MIILNIEPYGFSESAKELLSEKFCYKEYMSQSDDIPFTLSKDVDVLITRLQREINGDFLSKFPNCKYIICAATGHDHLDVDYIKKSKIGLITLRGETEFLKTIPSTAEHTMGLILSLLRNIPNAVSDVAAGNWNRDKFRGFQLYNKRIGLIGLGRIGTLVAAYCKAFGMDVYYYDPFVENREYHKVSKLSSLLSQVDIISMHVHISSDTMNMIGKQELSSMKKGSFIINTSRGRLLDELQLVDFLKNGYLKGVAVDVLSDELEDISQSPLYKAMKEGYNVVITPHLGGATHDAMNMCEEFVVKKLFELV